jgi:hypothetical protein
MEKGRPVEQGVGAAIDLDIAHGQGLDQLRPHVAVGLRERQAV